MSLLPLLTGLSCAVAVVVIEDDQQPEGRIQGYDCNHRVLSSLVQCPVG